MHKPTWGLVYWEWFLIVVPILFVPAETFAFFTNTANTLSDFAWYELGINGSLGPHNWAWWLSLVAWSMFVIVITGHIWFVTPG